MISSKAQMSPNSSYISDVYSVYSLSPETKISQDLSTVLSHLCFVANAREGVLTKTVVDREFIISWLKNNIDYKLLQDKDSIISSIFEFDKKNGMYALKDERKKKTNLLKDVVKAEMQKLCQTGSFTLLDSYIKISETCEEYGTMELGEFKNYISDFAIENGKIYGYTQLNFF